MSQRTMIRLLGIGGMLLLISSGLFNHYIREARGFRDFVGLTPFHNVQAQAFTTPEGRQCVSVQMTRRDRCDIADPPLVASALGAGGKTFSADIQLLNGEPVRRRVLAPGRVEIGPFCLATRNPPIVSADFYLRHRCPELSEVRPNLLAHAEWMPEPAQEEPLP